ncbi:hypothetical protein [Lacibacter sediminis]|uniref:Uncharacterized protein n=1 Tax=Lacibacter sediminis TaxID=2760713 RepID=A0A7G5XFQ7_9BACT|nr:hypothetical protein [Lacibacter sediminis]QNA44310.1 hypothetical protein H4075_19945 [Lacibacter sediminis]
MFIVIQLNQQQPEFRMIMQGAFAGYQILSKQITVESNQQMKLDIGWRNLPVQRRILSPGVYLFNQEVKTDSFHALEYYPADTEVKLPFESIITNYQELYINTADQKLLDNEAVSVLLEIDTE